MARLSRPERVPRDPLHRGVEILLAIASSSHSDGRHEYEFHAEQLSDCPHELCRTACRHAARHGVNPDERRPDAH